jgi:hypothetical protein
MVSVEAGIGKDAWAVAVMGRHASSRRNPRVITASTGVFPDQPVLVGSRLDRVKLDATGFLRFKK